MVASNQNMATEKKPNKKSNSKRILLWVVIVALLVLAAWAAYYLSRYTFNNGYRDFFAGAYIVEDGSEFSPIKEDVPSVDGMQLAAENDVLKLYTDTKTAQIALYDKRDGNIVYSNPINAQSDTIANKTNMNYLMSQFILSFYNPNRTMGTFDSYSMSVEKDQVSVQSLDDGIRYIYKLGEPKQIAYYVPHYLSPEKFDEIIAQSSEANRANFKRVYLQAEEGGVYALIATTRTNLRAQAKLDKALQAIGFTQDDYYEQMALGSGEAEPISFSVSLEYRLNGDSLEVHMPVSSMEENGGGKIYQVQLLTSFGAAGQTEQGYMVVPNGSGALINFNNGKNSTAAYGQFVYGADSVDASYTKVEMTIKARMPVFGICRGDSSIMATIERGSSIASINADVAGRYNSYNTAYPSFILRGYDMLSMFGVTGTEADMPILEAEMYDEDITVRYTLLGAESSGYVGMANAYRQRLIDEGTLTKLESAQSIPFYYDVIGGVKRTSHLLGVRYHEVFPMTTFEEAGEIAQALSEAGVENQVMNLQGWFNGGYFHDVADKVRVTGKLGGKKGLESLDAQLSALGGTLFTDVAFQMPTAVSKRFSPNNEGSRYYGAGYIVQLGRYNPALLRIGSALGYEETLYYLLSPKYLPYYVGAFAEKIERIDVSGISLRDLADDLHADKRRSNVISREQALDVVLSQLDVLEDTGKQIMLNGSNSYAFGYADHIINVPLSANEYFIIDQTIPLYQMILHGCVNYAGSKLNTASSGDWTDEVLKHIEYGASSHYVFTWKDAVEMKYTGLSDNYATTFSTWKDSAVDVYHMVNEALAPVSGALMVGHEVLLEDVVKVSYDNGISILINYGYTDEAIDGVTIPAKSYVQRGSGQ